MGILFIIATPIGNLADLSERATETLRSVAGIAAEDTRHTQGLLRHLGIQKNLVAIHGHSSRESVAKIVEHLKSGEDWAYVSDAGTPGISDPGAELVAQAVGKGIKVVPIPGPSALTALLSVAGFSETEFAFLGFFPREKKERKELWEKCKKHGGVFIGYESPHRWRELLASLQEFLPDAQLVVGRELTKKFEEISHGSPMDIAAQYAGREEILGEFVLAIRLPQADSATTVYSHLEIVNFLEELSGLGGNQKVILAAGKFLGLSRNEAYDLALKMKQK